MAVAVVGLVVWLTQTPVAVPVVEESPRPTTTPVVIPVAENGLPEATSAPWKPGAPRDLRIPALRVDSVVVPIQTADRVLTPPSDPQQLGWWADGARPGDRRGSVLLTGHTVNAGGGALDDLETLRTGDEVVVTTRDADLSYAVTSVRVFGKGDLATKSAYLFSQQVPGRLVIVTCEDWNGTEYLSNVVVVAEPRP